MGQKLNPQDLALYRTVDEVLHYIWDPIGISTLPQARNEYYGYLPQVFSLLRDGSDRSTIACYLSQVMTEGMGLSENVQHNLNVADVLLDWKEFLRKKHT